MTRDKVLEILGEHGPELRQQHGVKSLWVFGSVARGESSPTSDVDVLVEFIDPPTFDRFMDLKFRLEGLLGARVDLVTQGALRPAMREDVEREALRVA